MPDNCSFDVASAEGYWDFLEGDKAGFVFLRYLGWLADWRTIFTSMYDNLEPGGWMEVHEWVLDVECADGSLEGSALAHWNSYIHQGRWPISPSAFPPPLSSARDTAKLTPIPPRLVPGLARLGKTAFHAYAFEPILQDLGFRHLRQRRLDVPINAWSTEDERYREIGALSLRSELAVLRPLSHVALCEGLGWPQVEVDALVDAVARDMQDEALRGYISM